MHVHNNEPNPQLLDTSLELEASLKHTYPFQHTAHIPTVPVSYFHILIYNVYSSMGSWAWRRQLCGSSESRVSGRLHISSWQLLTQVLADVKYSATIHVANLPRTIDLCCTMYKRWACWNVIGQITNLLHCYRSISDVGHGLTLSLGVEEVRLARPLPHLLS
jgi:hypothetical protein